MPTGPGDLLQFARTHVLDSVRHARSSVWLASPFLSRPVAQRLADAAAESGATDTRMLTPLQALSVRAGALDPGGLRLLQDAGFAIRTIGNLYAKLTLVDGTWGLVGSGNLTNAGLGNGSSAEDLRGNVELGVLLDQRQVIDATTIFSEWWEFAADVSAERLDELAALPRFRREPLPGSVLPVSTNAAIEAILGESESYAAARTYFMKAAYYRPGQDEDGWWLRGWISDRKRPPYEIGDLIVLYLGGDGSPQCCPAILEVRAVAREDADFVERHGRGAADRKYPFVTRSECVFDIPITRAPRPERFGIDARSTQYGYRRLSRNQFEDAAKAMTSA